MSECYNASCIWRDNPSGAPHGCTNILCLMRNEEEVRFTWLDRSEPMSKCPRCEADLRKAGENSD